LLIAGKGHETTQIIDSKALPFNDIEIALDALI
jgi:UDP-N-acetylmuramyl tripeptide synthase